MPLSSGLLVELNTNEELLTKQLIHDVKDIFNTMVGLHDLLNLPIPIDPVNNFNDCISALVGLAGSHNALVSLHLPTAVALRATSCMLAMEVTEINDDVNDAMGEIANMIAGSFKLHLSKSGVDIQLSTPSIVYGQDYIITLGNNPEQIAVRFATDEEWFMVAVAFDAN